MVIAITIIFNLVMIFWKRAPKVKHGIGCFLSKNIFEHCGNFYPRWWQRKLQSWRIPQKISGKQDTPTLGLRKTKCAHIVANEIRSLQDLQCFALGWVEVAQKTSPSSSSSSSSPSTSVSWTWAVETVWWGRH